MRANTCWAQEGVGVGLAVGLGDGVADPATGPELGAQPEAARIRTVRTAHTDIGMARGGRASELSLHLTER